MDEVEDGKVEVIGPDLDKIQPPGQLPLAIVAEVAGRQMQEDFEPILERQIHHLINYAQGTMHIGQRTLPGYELVKELWIRDFDSPILVRFSMQNSIRTLEPFSIKSKLKSILNLRRLKKCLPKQGMFIKRGMPVLKE